MAHCKVYGNKPGEAPGQLTSQNALDNVNTANPTWHCTMVWNADQVVYTSAAAGATEDAMQTAFDAIFSPAYHVVAYD